jgi:uncharacterized protein (DUF1778 family)
VSTTSKAEAGARINLRIAAPMKANLLKAAKVSGRSLTDFVLASAVASAQDVLSDRTNFALSPKDWRKFNALLDSPPRDIPRLKRLFREKSIFEKR